MISLLLTLFISLFSIGSPIHKIEDQYENNEITINEYYSPKMAYQKNDNYLFTYVDFHSNFFLNSCLADIQNNEGSIDQTFIYERLNIYVSKWENTEIVTRSDTYGDVDFIDDSAVTLIKRLRFRYQGSSLVNNIKYYVYAMEFMRSDDSIMLTSTIMAFGGFDDSGVIQHFDLSAGLPLGFVVNSSYIARFSEYVFLMYDTDIGYSYNHVLVHNLTNGLSESEQYNAGYNDGYNTGYQYGYGTGYAEGTTVDTTASTIFTGILDVALIPVNVFLTIFNFEVFGINIAGIVSSLLTISVVVIIIRFVTGKKDD